MLRAGISLLGRLPFAAVAIAIIVSAAHASCGGTTDSPSRADAADVQDGMSYADTGYDR
jgi:hypothetical protein